MDDTKLKAEAKAQHDAAADIIPHHVLVELDAATADSPPSGFHLSLAAEALGHALLACESEEDIDRYELALEWYEARAGSKADAYRHVRSRLLSLIDYHKAEEAQHKAVRTSLDGQVKRLDQRLGEWLVADAQARGEKPKRKLADGGSVWCSYRKHAAKEVAKDLDALHPELLRPTVEVDRDKVDALVDEAVASDAYAELAPGEHLELAPGLRVVKRDGWSKPTWRMPK